MSDWCYDVAIGSSDGLKASDLTFALRDVNGSAVNLTPGTPAIQLVSGNGTSLGSYSFTTSSWTSGGRTPLSTTQTVVLDLGCAVSGSNRCSPVPVGEVFVALAVAGFTGQVQVTLT
ncbi:MAG TPA: hypothetical protein VGU43_03935 [Thermoplasmata archaeon]|nr:hypothetical protein [Thermoplasmata archaeon]